METQQGVYVDVADNVDAAAIATVAAIGTSTWHKLLVTAADSSVSTRST